MQICETSNGGWNLEEKQRGTAKPIGRTLVESDL